MTEEGKKNKLFGLSASEQSSLFAKLRRAPAPQGRSGEQGLPEIPAKLRSFSEFPALKQLRIEFSVAKKSGIKPPFFLCHDGLAKATTRIGGVEYLNFSTYDYLDLNGSPEIERAAEEALRRYGTSASASRVVAGERPPHRELEQAFARFYGVEDAIVYVSGHACNVSTIGKLFGPSDVLFHDALSHNSIVQGALSSGAKRVSFPHNDCAALEKLLKEHRAKAQRALIVTEGVFSMDGNIADLPGLLRLKKDYGCFLMIDEAHSFGTIGRTGHGISEHFGIDPREVDIWMGTLSKTCCGCGGYIAGTADLIELLKFTSPGFVYSVGMSPVLAAASLQAVRMLEEQPWRVEKLQEVSHAFVSYAKEKGLDTGRAEGTPVVPIMLGNSLLAGTLATRVFARRVNVMPIIYPVVEEGAARLRFFLSAAHSVEQVRRAIDIVAEELPAAREHVASFSGEN